MKNNIGDIPKFGLGSFIARSVGLWFLFVILFYLILGMEPDMSTGIALLLGMVCSYAQLFSKQLAYLNKAKQEIAHFENDIDITRSHLRQLKHDLLPAPDQQENQANLLAQVHKYEDKFTQDKLTYNALISNYNSTLQVMPVQLLARRFGHTEKEYFSDFWV